MRVPLREDQGHFTLVQFHNHHVLSKIYEVSNVEKATTNNDKDPARKTTLDEVM